MKTDRSEKMLAARAERRAQHNGTVMHFGCPWCFSGGERAKDCMHPTSEVGGYVRSRDGHMVPICTTCAAEHGHTNYRFKAALESYIRQA